MNEQPQQQHLTKITCNLYWLETIALIIPSASNVIYQQQIGGHSCLQQEMEGAVVPVDKPNILEKIQFAMQYGVGGEPINETIAGVIETVCANVTIHDSTYMFCVDRGRMNQSYEAWVHINYSVFTPKCIRFMGPAILTWPNSD